LKPFHHYTRFKENSLIKYENYSISAACLIAGQKAFSAEVESFQSQSSKELVTQMLKRKHDLLFA